MGVKFHTKWVHTYEYENGGRHNVSKQGQISNGEKYTILEISLKSVILDKIKQNNF